MSGENEQQILARLALGRGAERPSRFALAGKTIWIAGHNGMVGNALMRRMASQPISQDALLSGPLEPTIQWDAIAKTAAAELAEAYAWYRAEVAEGAAA